MKTKQFFTLIVVMVFVSNVFATETPKMSIIPLKNTKALVAIEHGTSVNEITITDENRNIRYYKKSKNEMDGYKKIFDLSQLEEGSYEVMFKAGNATVKRNFCIEKGNITVKQQRMEMDPYFAFANNILKVSYLNYENEDVTVNVYNNRKLIFSSVIGNEFALHKAINLSELQKGKYDVMLANADKEYWFSVSK